MHLCFLTPMRAGQGRLGVVRQLLEVEPEMAAAATDSSRLLPVTLALANGHRDVAACLLAHGCYWPEVGGGIEDPAQLLRALSWAGDPGLPLWAELAARFSLSPGQWEVVPLPCPALGAALPAVLSRSASEARRVVSHLLPADAARLRTALLSLHRAQQLAGMELPRPLLPSLLTGAFS